jgi:hypothetical protein
MADDVLILRLEPYSAVRLAERAEAMGLTPEELATLILDARFFDYDAFTWADADPQGEPLNTLHETGRPWSEVRPSSWR